MKIFGLMTLGVVAAAGVLAGCATRSSAQMEAPVAGGGGTKGGDDRVALCPTLAPGTFVASTDVEGGAALVFTTDAALMGDLRQRVRRIAEMNNRADTPDQLTSSGRMMAASSASAEDTEKGARLVLVPKDASQLQALREDVRMRARRIAKRECPIILPGTEGMPGIPQSPGSGSEQMAHEPPPSGK